MAGFLELIADTQKPRVHKYTQELLERAAAVHGKASGAYRGIYNQYFRMPSTGQSVGRSTRHFDALMVGDDYPECLERLYRRVAVVDLLSACASECVFCVRGMYERHTISTEQIAAITKYVANDEYLAELLITGGDPLISPNKLNQFVTSIAENAPNIKTVRVGTRLPVQNPLAFNDETYRIFERYADRFLFETAIQINHPFELQPETIDVIQSLQQCGVRLYSQNVLLKDVNDDIETLIDLYDQLRSLRLIPYYFYHAVPMVGMDDFRTSVQKGIDLTKQLTTSGYLSGMGKPMYTIMTDIGKVTMYEGSILEKNGRLLTVRTSYRLEDRLRWNPGYQLPPSATVNEQGTLDVTYIDGED